LVTDETREGLLTRRDRGPLREGSSQLAKHNKSLCFQTRKSLMGIKVSIKRGNYPMGEGAIQGFT
jgi:hypothetical protein